ncbi:MAG: histidine kinase [Bacteroidetes bacterium]|nr:histidine kinase [Bacteroidota bacterium]
MRSTHIIISCFLSVLSFENSIAQNLAVNHYINNEHLASNIVYDMEFAADGLLLFATDNGIVQFNGSEFSPVSYFGEYKNLSIISLYKHSDGSVMATTCDNKILISHPDSAIKFMRYKIGNYCFDHIFQNNNELYSYHNRYVYHINKTSNKFEIDDQRFILPNQQAFSPFTTFRSKIYSLVNSNLYQYHPDRRIELQANDLNSQLTACFAFKGVFYVTTHNAVYKSLDVQHFEKIFSVKEDQKIGNILPDEDNKIYFEIKEEGLFVYDLNAKSINNIISFKQAATFIISDENKNIWVGTYGDGIFCISQKLFHNLTDQTNSTLHITDIASNQKGKLVAGTSKGLMIYDSFQKTLILSDDKYAQHYIWDVNYSPEIKQYTVSTVVHGLNKKTKKSAANTDIIFVRSTCNLVSDSIIYFAAWDHVAYYKPNLHAENFYRFQFTEYSMLPKFAPDIRTNVIFKDSHHLLIGCNLGLYASSSPTNHDMLKLSNINALKIQNDYMAHTWVVTPKNIFKLKRNKLWKQNIGKKYNLTFTDIAFIPDTNLYFISTKSGLLLKTPENEILLNQSLGLMSQEVTSLDYDSFYGYLWIGTTKGLHYVALKDIYTNLKQTPKPYIIINEKVIQEDIKIDLTANTKSYNIQYAALALFHFKNINYRYRINHAKWIYSKSQNIDLLLQNPGNYKLEICCTNSGLIWSKPITITLDKAPYLWQTLFAKIFIVVVVLLLGFMLTILRIKRIKKREAANRNYEKQINEFKFKAFSASINPHFVFNSLNSLQYLVNVGKPKIVNEYIKSFARLLRLNIDDIDQTFVSLNRELERVKNYMAIEKMRFGDKIRFELEVDEQLDGDRIQVPGMILQPFVENSIKHGFQQIEEGLVRIHISKLDEDIQFVIQDNGKGIHDEKMPISGKGNKLVNDRLQVIFNLPDRQFVNVLDEDENLDGYKIKITIPLTSK